MKDQSHFRQIPLRSVLNFRDLGGYMTEDGLMVAWQKLYRSGALHDISSDDLVYLTEKIKLTSVIDLRNSTELAKEGVGPIETIGIRYNNVALTTNNTDRDKEDQLIRSYSRMGQVYLYFFRHREYGNRVVEVLEIMANPANYPLVFHCAVGKDRTGCLSAIVLSLLGIPDDKIVEDYTLSTPYMRTLYEQLCANPQTSKEANDLPGFFWDAPSESMFEFLNTIRKEYGSFEGYIRAHGADPSLIGRLKKALLV